MPTTPGICWTKQGNQYRKQIMAYQMSFGQIQWLNYMQETECFDKNGVKHQLEYGYYRGEVDFKGYKPDGYVKIDGEHRFFEYLGKTSL